MKHSPTPLRQDARNEAPMDVVVHVIAIPFAINASLWLLAHFTGLLIVVSAFFYCVGLHLMILASAAYDLSRHGPAKEIPRHLDHAVIFVMIAGT
jgi:hemolysin III